MNPPTQPPTMEEIRGRLRSITVLNQSKLAPTALSKTYQQDVQMLIERVEELQMEVRSLEVERLKLCQAVVDLEDDSGPEHFPTQQKAKE